MCGGGSSAASTNFDWSDEMEGPWNRLINTASYGDFGSPVFGADGRLSQRASYTNPDGTPRQRYAPLSQMQTVAGNSIFDLHQGTPGLTGQQTIAAGDNARAAINKTLTDGYTNPYVDQFTQTDRNLFAGDNPYFRNMLQQGMEDITSAYQQGTAADTTRKFALAGTFGGKAHDDIVARNEAGLGKSLTNYTTGMLNDQFNRSAGLEDSFLSRDLQNQQYNKSGAMGAYDADAARRMQAIGYGQNEQGLALNRADALMNWGNTQRGVNQQNLDFDFEQWNEGQNWPYKQLDWLSGIYSRAQGGTGQQTTMYPSNGVAQGLGGLLAAASLFR